MAKGQVAITVERCKGCGFCVEFCPTHVLALSSAFNSKGYHPPHVVDRREMLGLRPVRHVLSRLRDLRSSQCTLTLKAS